MSVRLRKRRFRSRTDPAQYHTVHFNRKEEAAVCTCPGYTAHGRCWHVRRALKMTQEAIEERQNLPAVIAQPSILPTPNEIETMLVLSKQFALVKGHSIPRELDTPAKVFAVLESGREVGAPPFVALRHVFVVNGKTALDGQLMLAIVKARDPSIEVGVNDSPESCTVRIRKPGKEEYKLTYRMEDVPAFLRNKDGGNWNRWPRRMLLWHTVKHALTVACPEHLNAIAQEREVAAAEAYFASGGVDDDVTEAQATAVVQSVEEPEPPSDDSGPGGEPSPQTVPSEYAAFAHIDARCVAPGGDVDVQELGGFLTGYGATGADLARAMGVEKATNVTVTEWVRSGHTLAEAFAKMLAQIEPPAEEGEGFVEG